MDQPSERTDGSGTWVSMREAAERTGVTVSKVRGLYRAGRIRSRKPADWTHKESTRRPVVMVVLEDVLTQVGNAKPEPHTPDRPPPSTEELAASTPRGVDREEWSRITAQLEELRRTGDEVAVIRERAARAEKERDGLRKTLEEVQERVERLERLYAAVDPTGPAVDPTGPSDRHGKSAGDAAVPDPDVEVEWGVEEPEESRGTSRLSFLRRRES
jgi:hypothetical protein